MSQFHPEDSLGSQLVTSNQDVILASDRDQTGAGDIVFKTGGAERARIKYDGSGSGWANVVFGAAGGANQVPVADGAGGVTWQQVGNAQVAAGAAIAYSKLNLAGSVTNADIANAAAIAYSKLALAGSVTNADIAVAAAIAYSKLNLSASVTNADIAAAAGIVYSKLNLAGSIVNADVAAGAAIALSKLADPGSGKVVTSAGAGAVAAFPPGYEFAYVEFTGNVTAAVAAEASPTDVVSAGAVTFDGSTRVKIEVFAPFIIPGVNGVTTTSLWDATTNLGRVHEATSGPTATESGYYSSRFLTPSAGSHTYKARAYSTGAAGTIAAGAGSGSGTYMPGFIRITKA